MVNVDLSVGEICLINGSVKVMKYLRIQKDNLKCKKQGLKCLRWQPEEHNDPQSNSNKSKSFMVYHQNVSGLLKKSEELISFLSPDFPQVLCLSEHLLKPTEIDFIYTDQYKLGDKLCRESLKMVELVFLCMIPFSVQILI